MVGETPTHQEQGRFQGPPPPPTPRPGPAWPPSGREAGRGGGRSDTSAQGGASRPLKQGGFTCGGASYRPQLSLPSRSHLQPPSYGPVLSPVSKAHGAINKLPSVNQLVGQPPLHGSAAAPSLGPMGEWRGKRGRDGRGGPEGGPGSRHPSSGPRGALDSCSLQQLPPRNRRHGHRRSPLSTPGLGEGRALRASPAQPGTPGPAPSDRPTCLPPRLRDTQQPRPRPAGQRRDKRRPQLPVHGLGVPLYPATPLPRRPQPGQVRGPLPAAATNPLTSALVAAGRLAPSPGAVSACCPSQPVL